MGWSVTVFSTPAAVGDIATQNCDWLLMRRDLHRPHRRPCVRATRDRQRLQTDCRRRRQGRATSCRLALWFRASATTGRSPARRENSARSPARRCLPRRVIHSRTFAPRTMYSSTTPSRTRRIALNRPNSCRQRTAADFFDGWRGFARIVERRSRAGLPSRIDAVGDPHGAGRLRRRRLSARRLAVGLVIRAGRERSRRDAGPLPHRRDAEQIGVEPDPEPAAEVQDQAARREIARRKLRAGAPCVEH